MIDLQGVILSKATQFRLLEHGLTAVISKDNDAPDPLLSGIGTTYGPHEDMTAEHFMMPKIDAVKDYCINTLNCTIDDIIWRPIEIDYKADNGLMVEEDYDVNGGWHDDVIGFIYIKKDEALKIYNETEVNADIEALIEAEFQIQLGKYGKWAVRETYKVQVSREGLPSKFSTANVYDLNGELDEAANELIDQIVSYVDSEADTVNLVLNYYDDYLFTGENLPVYFNKLINKHFGFTPLIGKINLNGTIGNEHCSASINISMKHVPPFLTLAAASPLNMFAGMQKYWCNFDAVELGENKPYSEWSDTMIEALFHSLLNFTNGIVIQHASKVNHSVK